MTDFDSRKPNPSARPAPARATGHGLHLTATQRALSKQIEEIERLARDGKTPGAGGVRLPPLPPELWAEIAPLLQLLADHADALARRNAPDGPSERDAPQPVGATLRWMGLLLRRMEETLEELEPGAIVRKFGPFPDAAEVERLAAEEAEMRAALGRALDALEIWRKKQKNP